MALNQEEKWLLEEKYHGEKTEGFFTDCERLNSGEPLAYIIGYVPFLNCKIWLDSRPLIPRPETEFWAEKAISEIQSVAPTAPHVLDLCSGSGCIGVAVGKAISDAQVDFAEIDITHLSTIQKNLAENLIIYDKTRMKNHIYSSDLFEKISKRNAYDFILTNPPYIDPLVDRAEKSVKEYEPLSALYGGYDGMELIERIISESSTYLNYHGQLWIEHEPEQSQSIQILANEHGFIATTHKDQYGVERYSVLMLK